MVNPPSKQVFFYILFLLFAQSCAYSQNKEQCEVYITQTGSKYHRSDCRHLRLSRFKVTLNEALQRGYTACNVCKPIFTDNDDNGEQPLIDDSSSNSGSAKPAQSPSSQAGQTQQQQQQQQCTAFTKTGARCKRTASSNGRCWQHQ